MPAPGPGSSGKEQERGKHALSTYYMPHVVLNARDTFVNKMGPLIHPLCCDPEGRPLLVVQEILIEL